MAYTPVLKARPSELEALTDSRGRPGAELLPLMELVPHSGTGRPRGLASEVLYSLEQVRGSWPAAHYLDVRLLGSSVGGRASAWRAVDFGRTEGLGGGLIPVVGVDDAEEVVVAAAASASAAGRLAVRVGMSGAAAGDASLGARLAAVAAVAGLGASAVDVLLDWADAPETLSLDRLEERTVAALARVGSGWNRVVVLGTAAPASVPGVGMSRFPRREWWLWLRTRRAGGLGPEFGDYAGFGVPNPGGGIARIANVRYSRGSYLFVFKRRSGAGLHGFLVCAQDIVGDADLFLGADFSTGDRLLAEVAEGRGAPSNGNATVWRTIALAHHLALVRRDLEGPPDAPPPGTDPAPPKAQRLPY